MTGRVDDGVAGSVDCITGRRVDRRVTDSVDDDMAGSVDRRVGRRVADSLR